MNEQQQSLERIVREKQLNLEASRITTAPLLRKGWMLVLLGWGISLIPILGVLGWVMAPACAIIVGILVVSRGNSGGGLTLLLGAWLGTVPVVLGSLLFWMIFGFSGLGFLGSLMGGW